MKLFSILALMAAACVFVAVGSAGNGKETHFGPFNSTTTDRGTCGNDWATDTFDRDFKVKDNGDGTFRVREEFKNGSFVTLVGPSPGACETDSHHGTLLAAGHTGNMHGYLEGTVTAATLNANACATPAACTTTDGFLTSAFGAAGPTTFTCDQGYAGCSFNFEYSAGDQGLAFHHWQDASTNPPGGEIFRGDIADS
jgi:hypothetical protein